MMGKTILRFYIHLCEATYVKYANVEGFAETATYSIVPILVAPHPSLGAPPPTSGVYSRNPAVVAEYGMFVHIIILTTVN